MKFSEVRVTGPPNAQPKAPFWIRDVGSWKFSGAWCLGFGVLAALWYQSPVELHEIAGAYRSRLAPSPTGLLHLGHARTFWTAQERARAQNGILILRNEDLDRSRCRPEFVSAMYEDLHWFGLEWQEGPDCGGPFGPYSQSERIAFYRAAFE